MRTENEQDPVRSGRVNHGFRGSTLFRPAIGWTVFALFGVGATGVVLAVVFLNRPTVMGERDVIIQKGMTVEQIGRLLHQEGVIRSPRLLSVFSLISGTSRRFKAGVHKFQEGMNTWHVLQELAVSRDVTRGVTIPEGLRLEQTIRLLAKKLDLDETKLSNLASDGALCRQLGVQADNLEGYLFPETYQISLTMDEKSVIEMLVGHFFTMFDAEMIARVRQIDMSVHEVVTLASIIEGEALMDDERTTISAVYHNRLKRGMHLQADPTVQYAIGGGSRRLFYKDYKIDSPYNTYRHRGLPPGPVTNPGAVSLRAALYPADVDYLYFVAMGDGTHVFSRTFREHENAKRKTRWARRRSWQRSRTP